MQITFSKSCIFIYKFLFLHNHLRIKKAYFCRLAANYIAAREANYLRGGDLRNLLSPCRRYGLRLKNTIF